MPENRDRTGRFKPGCSGNEGGRPKDEQNVREMARAYTTEALNTLVEVMRTGDLKERAQAASALLDRGWGRAASPVELTGAERVDPLGVQQVREAAVEALRDPELRKKLRAAVRGEAA